MLKDKGNQAFHEQKYQEALNLYTQAIQENPSDCTLYSNRSAVLAQLQKYEEALLDANKCINLNPNWIRGYLRKGLALFYLNRYQESIQAYKDGLKMDPNNNLLQESINQVQEKLNNNKRTKKAPMKSIAVLFLLLFIFILLSVSQTFVFYVPISIFNVIPFAGQSDEEEEQTEKKYINSTGLIIALQFYYLTIIVLSIIIALWITCLIYRRPGLHEDTIQIQSYRGYTWATSTRACSYWILLFILANACIFYINVWMVLPYFRPRTLNLKRLLLALKLQLYMHLPMGLAYVVLLVFIIRLYEWTDIIIFSLTISIIDLIATILLIPKLLNQIKIKNQIDQPNYQPLQDYGTSINP